MKQNPAFFPRRRRGLPFSAAVLALSGWSCSDEKPVAGPTYYERSIEPILHSSCATSPSGSACHLLQDTQRNAFGNLSFDSYENLAKRQDLLAPYGPYALPNLLLKALPPFQLALSNWTSADPTYITTNVAHAGGGLLDVTSVSFSELSRWISRGATENNTLAVDDRPILLPCSNLIGTDADFDPNGDPTTDDFATFSESVNPVLGQRCAAGNCHGSPGNSMHLTCGDTPEERRWNYFEVSDYVSATYGTSEIVRRALDPAVGGTFHEGGTVFTSSDDPDYQAIVEWAKEKGGPSRVPDDLGFEFFADRVQPMLVKKGCMQLGCHSPSMGHEYRLHGGSAGHFSLPSTRRNYELSLGQVSLESADPNASRILRKNLPPPRGGVTHRGGALFSDAGDVTACDLSAATSGPIDEQNPYCVIAAWIAKERTNRMPANSGMTQLVFVRSPVGSGPTSPQDFEHFAPGADLLRVGATLGADGWPAVAGTPESLLDVCGLSGDVDVRRPSVSWDGTRIAFSARTAASSPWRIYVIDGASCAVESAIDAAAVDEGGKAIPTNGELVHNFDPTFAPDGRIVFSSTRGNVTNTGAFDYQGPQRSPADPSRLNANLYISEASGIRQLTFLLDQEMAPSFMVDGRLIFSVEKRSPGFYQIAGRRMNLDGGDYHPLFGQRSTVGFNQFTDVVELSDRDLAGIFSQRGAARGAGTLAIINRSLGIDQRSPDPNDYLLNPGAIDWPNEEFYKHSIRLPDTAATGQLDATQGAYLNPSSLPNGRLLASYAANATNLHGITGSFSLVAVDPNSGERRELLSDPQDLLWPVAYFSHGARQVFKSKIDEPNGATRVDTDAGHHPYSDVTYLDLPLLSSLLFQNTRSGRPVPDKFGSVEFWEQLPPEKGVTSFANGGSFVTTDDYGSLYVRRRQLGSVTPAAQDGSAHVRLPGGVPFNLAVRVQLEADSAPTLHHQREAMQFYPGESARQSFPRELFNGVCANCHGSVSGFEDDIAANPDILTRASEVVARDAEPVDLGDRGDVSGPEFP